VNVHITDYYDINEHGEIFSKIKNRFLKPQQNKYGYIHYFLTKPINRWYYAHTLVAYKYLGNPLSMKYEVDHIDANKGNNHYSNLRWITHSDNILKSYREQGRKSYWKGKNKPSAALETRIKMANAKLKAIRVSGKVNKEFNSIYNACNSLGVYGKAINRAIKKNKPYKGMMFEFI
jgi:hypothetical protein